MPKPGEANGLPEREPAESSETLLPEDEVSSPRVENPQATTSPSALPPGQKRESVALSPLGAPVTSPPHAQAPLLAPAAAPIGGAIRRLSLLAGIAIVALLLWWARPVLLPVAIAVLLSFLLSPLCEWLERHWVPRAISVVMVVLLAFAVLGALGWAVFNGVQQLGNNIDRIAANLEAKLQNLPFQRQIEEVGQKLERAEQAASAVTSDEEEILATQPATGPATQSATQRASEPLAARLTDRRDTEAREESATQPTTQPVAARGESSRAPVYVSPVQREMTPLERLGYFLGVIAPPLGAAGLVIIFTFFILLQRDDLRERVITLAAGQQLNLATQALDDATSRISRYLLAQAIVNGTYGLAIGLGLEAISLAIKGEHFPSIWLWALLCAMLRFIPYLGPWIGAAFPLIISIGWWPGYEVFLATAGYIVLIELISNNVMEPLLYGSSTGMSPVAVIAAAVFWTFVWGPVGLLVATPLTTCLVVMGKYVPGLRFFDILLGDEPVLPPHSRLYQRMLALDAEDAEDVAEEYRKGHSLAQTFDDVLLPALALAEHDRHAGTLTHERADFIRETTREIVNQLSRQDEPLPSDSVDLTEPPPPAGPLPPPVRIVLIPSVDAADMTAALMLKALLDRRRYETVVVGEEELTSEKLESVFAQRADVAVISALPPRAVTRARYLVKRLRQAQHQRGVEAESLGLLVGLWTMNYDAQQAAARIRDGGPEIRAVTTLSEAVDEVRQRGEVAAAARRNSQATAPDDSRQHVPENLRANNLSEAR